VYCVGNWDLYYPIPMDRGGYDTFEILREELDTRLRDLLQVTLQIFTIQS
jgi:membrane metallo-endopeptidase-like protein 1